SALVATSKERAEEVTPIYADPGKERSKEAIGNEETSTASGTPSGLGSGIGGGPPSGTPGGGGGGPGVSGKTSRRGIVALAAPSGLALTPSAPALDLGGGGMIGGDVTYAATDEGVALDQIAREILRHLTQHRLTVIWLFDESESMKDDQRVIRSKFD